MSFLGSIMFALAESASEQVFETAFKGGKKVIKTGDDVVSGLVQAVKNTAKDGWLPSGGYDETCCPPEKWGGDSE